MKVQCECGHITNVSMKPIAAEAGYVCVCGVEHRKVWGNWCTVTRDIIVNEMVEIEVDCDEKVLGAMRAYIDTVIEDRLKGKV